MEVRGRANPLRFAASSVSVLANRHLRAPETSPADARSDVSRHPRRSEESMREDLGTGEESDGYMVRNSLSYAELPGALDATAIKADCDFLRIASQYSRLRRASRQYVGLCPFHPERHPSFHVHPERKIFYCFGCGAGGDVFDFVIRAENCDFRRALEIVSDFGVARAGEPRSGERFGARVGAKPLLPAKQAVSHSPQARTRVANWRDWQRFALAELNRRAARELATACEPLRSE
ncbi:MAG: CHC2 zinc finger domain-containing protein [Candidatus Acidiferrales bacterium]